MVRASLVHCTCTTHSCRDDPLGYTVVPKSTRQSHREDDMELSLKQLTLTDAGSPQVSGTQATADIVDRGEAHQITTSESIDVGPNSSGFGTDASVTQLISLLGEYQTRQKSIHQLIESLESLPEGSPSRRLKYLHLQEHISWITATVCNLQKLSMSGHVHQRDAFVRIMENKLSEIQNWERSCYDMRQKEAGVNVRDAKSLYESGKFFNHSLATSHPLIVLSMFITVALNVIQNLPERSSNYLLQMLRELLKLALNDWSANEELVQQRMAVITRLPKNIRTVRSRFGLEPQIQIFAACPKCSALYQPKYDATQDIDIYPVTHCNQTELDGKVCGSTLLKWRVNGKQTVRVPCRPFGYYSLHDFVGEMICRPGQEDLLERRPSTVEPDILTDVFDGSIIRDFIGPEGDKCFRKNGPKDSEDSRLYLAWAMCVDWYNPYHNKIAGKTVSIGVISMVCLNLPLTVRNEISNMYLVGIIPGPREPSLHRVNNFLRPVIKDLQDSWCKGVRYTRTYKYDNGRTVVSILIPLVADIPASRKVSGTTGHSSSCFCPLCLRKKKEMEDFRVTSDRRDRKEHMRLANLWRDAKTQRERNSLASKNGVRQSVVFDLTYWEPRFIVVDTMHNLFLGIIKHHFQDVLGIRYEKHTDRRGHSTEKGQKGGPISAKKIRTILKILQDPQGPTQSRLKRHSISELVDFHVSQKISLSIKSSDGLSKDNLVQSLMNCELVIKDHATQCQEAAIGHLNQVDEDTLPFSSLDDVTFFTSTSTSQKNAATPKVKPTKANVRYMDTAEIEAIQAAIRKTCRPSWQQGPPKAFGTSQQGKLKADQLRSLLEFDIPVTLVELWVDADNSCKDKKTKDKHLALVDSTMELAIAVSWGTSRRTSASHAAKYLGHLQTYLQGLLTQSPRPKIIPNHHFALHVSEQLLSFGPVDGWWAYPYERLIGSLQKINTGYRIGEVEVTILKNFYASAHLQRFFKSNECPAALSDPISLLEKCLPPRAQGSYGFNVSHSPLEGKKNTAPSKHEQLDDDIYDAVRSTTMGSQHEPTRQFLVRRSYIVNGVKYTSRELERDSIIFYESGIGRSPGVIRKIFSTASGVYFAVHRYLKPDCLDPFTRWPDFRAGLWSQKLEEKVQIIDPNSTYICHAARRAWKTGENFVLRAIDRNY